MLIRIKPSYDSLVSNHLISPPKEVEIKSLRNADAQEECWDKITQQQNEIDPVTRFPYKQESISK